MMSEDLTSRLKHPILPAETCFPGYVDRLPQETSQEHHQRLWTVLQNRCMEGNLNILTEFIESCCSSHLPFKAADTLERTGELFPESAVHSTHQLRFATAVKNMFKAGVEDNDRHGVLHAIINLGWFDVYGSSARRPDTKYFAWLENAEARESLKVSFATYLTGLSSADAPKMLSRVETIVAHLDILHPEQL
jgi:hypothetical protein